MAEQAVETEEEVLQPGQVAVGDDATSGETDRVFDDKGEEIVKPAAKPDAGEAPTGEDDDPDDRLVDSQASAEDAGRTDAEREAIRERRRQEKHRKRENFQAMKRELAARDSEMARMREELNVLSRRSAGGEMAQLDQAINQTAEAYNYFKGQIAEATSRADGEGVATATERMIQAREKHTQLQSIKTGYSQRQAQPAPLDPRLLSHAQGWMEINDWYDPAGKDDDSEVMRTVDNRLAQEGWDPKTPEYWSELSRRAAKYLPHRFTAPSNRGISPGKPRPTVGGSGREASPGTGSQGFVLSAARVAAIKEAGAWDDPRRRAAMIQRFRDYDRNTSGK